MKKKRLEFIKAPFSWMLDYAREEESCEVVMSFDRLPEEVSSKIVARLNGEEVDLGDYTFEKDPEKLGMDIVSVYGPGICDLDPVILFTKKSYVKKVLDLNK